MTAITVRCTSCGVEIAGSADATGVVRASDRLRSDTPPVAGLCIPCSTAPGCTCNQAARARAGARLTPPVEAYHGRSCALVGAQEVRS